MKNFENFVNLYELSRTLRFKLLAFENTKLELEKDWIIQKDRKIDENYHKIKEYLDELHREFVEESLKDISLNFLDEYAEKYFLYKENKKDKKIKNEFEKIEKNIRKELVSFFDAKWMQWQEKYSFLKKWWVNVLIEKEVLDLLALKFPEQKEIFESFDRFFTYFSKFNETRKNFYADDGRAWAIATRAIDENLQIFLDNKEKFELFDKENTDFFTEKERHIFDIEFYNFCISQSWINNYNEIIWAKALEEGKNTEWINQRINLKKQHDLKSNAKNKKYPKFNLLQKQILSKEEKKDFIVFLENNEELFEKINNSIVSNSQKINQAKNIFDKFLKDFENNIFNLEKIYISKTALNTLSNKYFENWNTLSWYLEDTKNRKYFSLSEIKSALNSREKDIFKDVYKKNFIIFDEKSNFENFLEIYNYEFNAKIAEIEGNLQEIKNISLNNFKKSEKETEIIKKYFDSVLNFYKMTKYFAVETKKWEQEEDKDIVFYEKYDLYIYDFEIWKDYNLVRNYLTKKDVKTDKFKLNFDNSQFLTWWDKDKEKERFWCILKKDNKYFLVILKKWNTKIFEEYVYNNEENFYEKMEYKQLNNVYRQIPRLSFPLQKKLEKLTEAEKEKYLKKYIVDFWYNEEIAKIKEEFDIFQKNKEIWEKFDQEKLNILIWYYKKFVLYKYSKLYDLSKVEKTNYEDLAKFYDDVEKSMYNLNFVKISSDYLENLEKSWEIYLFQIYNKDFSETKKENSKENIHTKYFKYLFDEKNLENVKIKLSWWAEIFFRDKTENLKQREKNGEKLFFEENGKTKEVLENRRYSKDTILFHISTTLNANSWDFYWFNQFFNKNFKPKHIIWVDRWEKHLAYFSVVDLKWKLIETWSLNIVNEINYLEKLEEKSKSRESWRENWWEIENIKNLKDGYISALVNKLCDLIIKYEAIIVFEDLNSWFKRWRQKIEKQIYQKLELALAKKLNYLTFKDKKYNEIWWILKGIQLVPKVNDYQDIAKYKQSWIIFYTNPAYTSTTCPKCGWRKTLQFPLKNTKESLKNFFKNIKIIFEGEKFCFEYENWNKITEKIYTNIERTFWNSKKMKSEAINITEGLIDLFKENNIDLKNISENINKNEVSGKFLEKLLWYFKIANSIRNSDKDRDFISCPCCGFYSDNWFEWFEFNWDANGAYNIARKGIIMLENIKVNPEKPNLFVKNMDWDEFLGRV